MVVSSNITWSISLLERKRSEAYKHVLDVLLLETANLVFQFKSNEGIRSLSLPCIPITDPKYVKYGILLLLEISSINHGKYGELQVVFIIFVKLSTAHSFIFIPSQEKMILKIISTKTYN